MSRIKFEASDLKEALNNQDIHVEEVIEELCELIKNPCRTWILPNDNEDELLEKLKAFETAFKYR